MKRITCLNAYMLDFPLKICSIRDFSNVNENVYFSRCEHCILSTTSVHKISFCHLIIPFKILATVINLSNWGKKIVSRSLVFTLQNGCFNNSFFLKRDKILYCVSKKEHFECFDFVRYCCQKFVTHVRTVLSTQPNWSVQSLSTDKRNRNPSYANINDLSSGIFAFSNWLKRPLFMSHCTKIVTHLKVNARISHFDNEQRHLYAVAPLHQEETVAYIKFTAISLLMNGLTCFSKVIQFMPLMVLPSTICHAQNYYQTNKSHSFFFRLSIVKVCTY